MTTGKKALAVLGISAVPCALLPYLGYNHQWLGIVLALVVLYVNKMEKYAIALIVALVASFKALALTPALFPITYDARLCGIDHLSGVNHSAIMALFESTRSVYLISEFVYLGFPLTIACALVLSANPRLLCAKLAVGSVIGYIIYCIVPACGPYYLFTSLATAPRNAFPSMHTSWALFMWLESRNWKLPYRVAFDTNLIFTLIATMGTGEHYAIDLVAAVPFTLAVTALVDYLAVQNTLVTVLRPLRLFSEQPNRNAIAENVNQQ